MQEFLYSLSSVLSHKYSQNAKSFFRNCFYSPQYTWHDCISSDPFPYRRGCHDPFQLSHSHCFSTSAHPSSKGRGSLGTWITFTETTHSGELLDLSALHILAKLFSHMPMAGSGHGGESLKVYIQCMGVEGICKTESRPV